MILSSEEAALVGVMVTGIGVVLGKTLPIIYNMAVRMIKKDTYLQQAEHDKHCRLKLYPLYERLKNGDEQFSTIIKEIAGLRVLLIDRVHDLDKRVAVIESKNEH